MNVKLLPKILKYPVFRRFGFPNTLPVNLTVSILYSCNSRCQTCNVYEKRVNNLTVEEYDKIFKSLGKAPFWFTISGGEPFLRKDIVDICQSAYKNCKPGIINIPTNGILYRFIPGRVEQIVKSCPDSQIIINLSLDETGERHDAIRGYRNNYQLALKTYQQLKELSYPNLTLGIHTVLSRYNTPNFPKIYHELIQLESDSYITEIAEERVELDTIGLDITPSYGEYAQAVDFLSEEIKKKKFSGISKVTQAFRLEYYRLVKQTLLKKTQVIPCYAGWASAQIAPDGDVWTCCIRAESIGNLRESNYDFKKIWSSQAAEKLRTSIRNKECYCPLANASYTNMLCSGRTLTRVIWRLLKWI
jgi:radical SAM protein with 4Fe4S-binding SPASM domain